MSFEAFNLSCFYYLIISFEAFNLLCIYYLIMSFILLLDRIVSDSFRSLPIPTDSFPIVTDTDRIISDSFRSLPIPTESFSIVSDRYRSKYVDYLEKFFKGFICIHILVTMDPRHTYTEDEHFLLNMIGEGQGDVAEQADDGSNTDIYLNMSVR